MIHKIASLYKHTTRTASGIEHDARCRLQYIDQHLYQRFGRKEHAIITGYCLGKLRQEIFIDSTNHITTHFINGLIIEDTKQVGQQVIGKHSVALGKNACQLFALFFHQLHSIIDRFA